MVTIDGDGQHDPRDIPALIAPVLEGEADVVIGSRFLGDAEKTNDVPTFRRWGIKVITGFANRSFDSSLSDAQSGLRAYGRNALESVSLYENGMGVSVEILKEAKKSGLAVVEVPTRSYYRGLKDTSTQSAFRHGLGVMMSIVRLVVEERPLLFLGLPGVISVLTGLLFVVWMLQIYSLEGRIVTNVLLASIAFTLVGLFAGFTAITLYAMARLRRNVANTSR